MPQHCVTRPAQQAAHGGIEVNGEAGIVDVPKALLGGAQQQLQQTVLLGQLLPCVISVCRVAASFFCTLCFGQPQTYRFLHEPLGAPRAQHARNRKQQHH